MVEINMKIVQINKYYNFFAIDVSVRKKFQSKREEFLYGRVSLQRTERTTLLILIRKNVFLVLHVYFFVYKSN